MSQTTYQVILSADGKHHVIVTTDNQAETKLAVAWAKATYEQLTGQLTPQRSEQHERSTKAEEEAPECAIHQTPMVWVDKGRRGPFWSCRHKNEDGSWCTYTRQPGER